jgi:hypothetical protein
VKAVVGANGRALYFSRSLVPFNRDGSPDAVKPLKHVGLYVYRRPFLPTFVLMPCTPLERTEQLEQLRVLENGYDIAVAIGVDPHAATDTPDTHARNATTHAVDPRMPGPTSRRWQSISRSRILTILPPRREHAHARGTLAGHQRRQTAKVTSAHAAPSASPAQMSLR